jgi:hypothetical protein
LFCAVKEVPASLPNTTNVPVFKMTLKDNNIQYNARAPIKPLRETACTSTKNTRDVLQPNQQTSTHFLLFSFFFLMVNNNDYLVRQQGSTLASSLASALQEGPTKRT